MASILLVDDDSYFRQIAVAALKARRHEVVEATRCRDADALLARNKFDVIIVDGLLPDLDGMSWIERFRATDSTTPVIFCSAFWKNDQRLKALPVSTTLKKPVTPGGLVSKVEGCLPGAARGISGLPPDAEREIQLLAASFERELPKIIGGIRDAIDQLRESPGSAPIRGVAQRRAHQLAGTAATFGFQVLGNACAQIEQALLNIGQGAGVEMAWRRIEAALLNLISAEPTGAEALSA
jgi:CheY-like chemotaxis protein